MRIAIVAGICVPDDAISAAVAGQASLLSTLAGVETVTIFAQHISRHLDCGHHEVTDPWSLLTHPAFRDADVAIFHWGIHYSLFDALVLLDRSSFGPRAVCHFHNCTPLEHAPESARTTMRRSLQQGAMLACLDCPVWTFSRFNELTLEEWGVSSDRVRFVPFPIMLPPPETCHGQTRRLDRLDLLAVGRFVPSKGQDVILDAIRLLPPDLRSALTVRLAGNASLSEHGYLATLHDKVVDDGLDEIVEFAGQPDDRELATLYARSHVLVSASAHEGLCVPVIEAYAAGCRVIGTSGGNLPYIVQPPDPVVPVGDASALAEAIMQMASEIRQGGIVLPPGAAAVVEMFQPPHAAAAHAAELHSLVANSDEVA